MQTTSDTTSKQPTAIERALAAARARAAAKVNLEDDAPVAAKAKAPKADKPAKEPKVKVVKESAAKAQKAAANAELTAQQKSAKAAKKAAEEAAKAERKAKRDAERAERRAAKEAEKSSKKPAHMKKVARAAGKLPKISSAAASILDEVTTNLSRVDIATLALHLQHFNRMKATEMSMGRRFKNGQRVRIVAGDLDNLGKVGTIESARPLRVFVNVPGVKKPVYVFTSEVELVEEASVKATGTEG